METVLVSACLLGEKCKYSGGSNYNRKVMDWIEGQRGEIKVIPVCPEVMGGLETPRPPAEIQGEAVVTADGRDVTEEYRRGAEKTLQLALKSGCRLAVLKERSPSCGGGEIYDGTFSHTVISGDGVTAALLKRHGIRVLGETDL